MTNGLTAEDVIGTWRLRTWFSEHEDGADEPMGDRPEGINVYTPDGTMITTIGRADRAAIDGNDMFAGPADQRLAAMASFISYSGTFAIDGGDILHTVGMSLFPNWVGTVQRRHVDLSEDGETLVLSTDPFVVNGRRSVQRLTWERVRG